jgi:hypothetical protein
MDRLTDLLMALLFIGLFLFGCNFYYARKFVREGRIYNLPALFTYNAIILIALFLVLILT